MKKLLVILMAAASLAICSTTVLAAGLQISPPKLAMSLNGQKTTSANLVVANPTADVQLFTVSADEFGQAITAMPASFTLQAGERKTISITVDAEKLQNSQPQTLATNISVVSRPLADNQVKLGTGVKIPLTVVIGNAATNKLSLNNILSLSLSALAIIGLAIWLAGYLSKRKNLRTTKTPLE